MEDLVDMLKDLQSRCIPQIFNKLMFCLSSPSITDHSEYKNWTPLSGRLKCFEKLRSYLELIYPISKEEIKIETGTFLNLILCTILNNQFYSKHINNILNSDENIITQGFQISLFSLLSLESKNKRNNSNNFNEYHHIALEDDINIKSKIPKDDNYLNLRKSNSSLKAIRNEKVSQSLIVNKISEIEQNEKENLNNFDKLSNQLYEIYDNENSEHNFLDKNQNESPQKINYRENKNYRYNLYNNNINVIEEEKSKKDEDLDLEDDLEDDNNMNNSIVDDNALSDLDKEEYFMKSCYDFFDYDITTLVERKVIEDSHPIRTSCFSSKGDYFAIGTNSKSIKLFDIKPVLQRFNKKNSYNFKNDINLNNKNSKNYNYENSNNNTTNNINQDLDDIRMVFEQTKHHLGSIYCLDWSLTGRLIASGSNDRLIKLMVVPNLEESFYSKDQETLELTIHGHEGTIRSVCFEPTNDLILLSGGICI